jgi:molybdopterin-guanine dinucleotide biosynthesis protein B
MRVLGLVGWSGSGKTTLLVGLLPLLRRHGLRVSTVKHAHAGFDMETPGKDSHRHREAGAHEVLVAGAGRWALLHETPGDEPALPELLARLDPVDLVLVEGFKTHRFPKLEVYRPALGKPPIWPTQADIVAVATDAPDLARGWPHPPATVLALDAPEAVADWLLGFLAVPSRRAAG